MESSGRVPAFGVLARRLLGAMRQYGLNFSARVRKYQLALIIGWSVLGSLYCIQYSYDLSGAFWKAIFILASVAELYMLKYVWILVPLVVFLCGSSGARAVRSRPRAWMACWAASAALGIISEIGLRASMEDSSVPPGTVPGWSVLL